MLKFVVKNPLIYNGIIKTPRRFPEACGFYENGYILRFI